MRFLRANPERRRSVKLLQTVVMPEAPVKPSSAPSSPQLSKRALLSLGAFVLLTLLSLTLAWGLPDATGLHFVWVAQAVPVLYVALMWWGSTDLPETDDER